MSESSSSHLSETEKALIRCLKKRGEDFDTVDAICTMCKTQANMAEYLAWLQAHPQAGHDELFCRVIDTYTDILRPRRARSR